MTDDEFEIITGSFDPAGARFLDLVEVMRRLRRDCAWTREQTHESLAPYLAEESEETLEAIESGDTDHLREELGDLLLQVVFHAVIAGEDEPGGTSTTSPPASPRSSSAAIRTCSATPTRPRSTRSPRSGNASRPRKTAR